MIGERETERASGSEAEPKHSLFRKKGKGREGKRREERRETCYLLRS